MNRQARADHRDGLVMLSRIIIRERTNHMPVTRPASRHCEASASSTPPGHQPSSSKSVRRRVRLRQSAPGCEKGAYCGTVQVWEVLSLKSLCLRLDEIKHVAEITASKLSVFCRMLRCRGMDELDASQAVLNLLYGAPQSTSERSSKAYCTPNLFNSRYLKPLRSPHERASAPYVVTSRGQ
ncbi:hypothetical protein EJ06DRAFT_143230 [Trichodelitschia bisporula]|uniref:Uncharacterized protein n=1 Tax=Trichodelitschia bisporula TaxID=703511 RepID=A0A6G1HPD9_9PEZI|nr:hypothetical protein EJ06DRAFT_143230 [Trichodelitschia bisporula]